MKTEEAVDHFGGRKALAQALNIWPHAIGRWGEYPPELRQRQIEDISGGALQREPMPTDAAVAR